MRFHAASHRRERIRKQWFPKCALRDSYGNCMGSPQFVNILFGIITVFFPNTIVGYELSTLPREANRSES